MHICLSPLSVSVLICVIGLFIVFSRHLGRWVKSSLRRGHATSDAICHHLALVAFFRTHVILVEVRRVCLFFIILTIVFQVRELVAVIICPRTPVELTILMGMPFELGVLHIGGSLHCHSRAHQDHRATVIAVLEVALMTHRGWKVLALCIRLRHVTWLAVVHHILMLWRTPAHELSLAGHFALIVCLSFSLIIKV